MMTTFWQIYAVIGAAFAAQRIFGFFAYASKRGDLFDGVPDDSRAPVSLFAAAVMVSISFILAAIWPVALVRRVLTWIRKDAP